MACATLYILHFYVQYLEKKIENSVESSTTRNHKRAKLEVENLLGLYIQYPLHYLKSVRRTAYCTANFCILNFVGKIALHPVLFIRYVQNIRKSGKIEAAVVAKLTTFLARILAI